MKKIVLLAIIVSITTFSGCTERKTFPVESCQEQWAVAHRPCPILNTPDFQRVFGGRNGATLKRDKVLLVREIEAVALPGSVFEIKGACNVDNTTIYKIQTPAYPYKSSKGFFVDSRFLELKDTQPEPYRPTLPSPVMMRYRLLSMVNSTYLWGGNYHEGIPEMMEYYKPSKPVYGDERKGWIFRGVDCSGLIYETTNGYTPRNASSLIKYGKPVEIQGLSAEEIAAKTKPFDLLGWRTHVMVVLDKDNIIQSRVDYDYDTPGNQSGVRVLPMVPLIQGLMESYLPVNSYDDEVPEDMNKFVIRRWYNDGKGVTE